jgi:hypothetical protein
MDNGYSPTILQGQHTNDDEILAKTPPLDPKALGGASARLCLRRFRRSFDRYVVRDGVTYDRALSRWAVVRQGADGPELCSHARYADEVVPVSSPEAFPFPTKKGTAGVGILNYSENDIKDLGATSATMNMNLNEYLA